MVYVVSRRFNKPPVAPLTDRTPRTTYNTVVPPSLHVYFVRQPCTLAAPRRPHHHSEHSSPNPLLDLLLLHSITYTVRLGRRSDVAIIIIQNYPFENVNYDLVRTIPPTCLSSLELTWFLIEKKNIGKKMFADTRTRYDTRTLHKCFFFFLRPDNCSKRFKLVWVLQIRVLGTYCWLTIDLQV